MVETQILQAAFVKPCSRSFFCVVLDYICVALEPGRGANTAVSILKCRLSIVSPRYRHKCLDGPYNTHQGGSQVQFQGLMSGREKGSELEEGGGAQVIFAYPLRN